MKQNGSQNIPLLISQEEAENTKFKEHGRGVLWFLGISLYIIGMQKIILYMTDISTFAKAVIYGSTLFLILLYCVIEVWQEQQKHWIWGAWLATAIVLILGIGLQTILQSSLYLINCGIRWWNITKSDGITMFQNAGYTVAGVTGCMLLFALVLLILLWWAMDSGFGWLSMIMQIACIVLVLQVGRTSWIGVSLILVGGRGLNTLRIGRGNRETKLFWFGLLLCSLLLISHLEMQDVVVTKTVRDQTKQKIEDLRYGENPLPEGNLYQAANMNLTNTQRLEVKSQVAKNLYLTGYTGAEYDKGQWSPLKKSAFGNSRSGMLKWLTDQKFYVNHIYGTYNQMGKNKNVLLNQLTIQNQAADRQEIFAPNSMISLEGTSYQEVRDSNLASKEWFGSNAYHIVENGEDIPGELLTISDWVKEPAQGKQQQYIKAEQAYRSFVYENYTRLDAKTEVVIRQFFIKNATADDKTGIYAITSYIRNVLAKRVRFVWQPKQIPADSDPITWFLQEGREGNSALYASTAVEAFRAFGIPARYAEGYYISKEQIVQAKNKAIHLTDQDAHAWVQVYMDAVGWVDIDVTPGFYYDEYTLMQMVEKPQGMQLTADLQDDRQDGGSESASTQHNTKHQDDHNTIGIVGKVTAVVVLLLCCLVALVTILEIRRLLCYFAWNRKSKKASRDKYAMLLETEIMRRIHCLGVEAALGWQITDTEKKLRKMVPSIYDGEYRFVNELLEKGIYGEEIPQYHELRAMLEFRDKLFFDAKVRGKIWYRIYIRYRIR